MTTERIDIVVREDGSRIVRRNLQDLGDTSTNTHTTIETLKRSLSGMGSIIAAMGIGFGIQSLIQYADVWANLEGRLKLVTTSTGQLTRVQGELFSIAQKTRSSLEATVDLHTRVARSTEALNVSDKQRLQVTENINKAIVISGSSATSAAAALVQLGQGFASGTLRGEELNSVLEQTPRLAEAIAVGMGKSVGQLRALGQAGLLTSEQVFKALESQSANLQAEFGKMPVTIAQSFTVLNNEVLKFVGTAAQGNGSARLLSDAILAVARNIDTIVAVMTGFLAMKFAEFFIGATVAIYNKVAALAQHINMLRMDALFERESAAAALASANATLVQIQATQAAIVVARNEAIARLAQSNANIQSARSAIAAATAAGSQSFALAILRTATAELAVAEAARTAQLAALAVLGQQQARVSATLTAATAAQTAAQAGLTAATTAGAGAATMASRALGLLGGPLGIILTVLGLGITAWSMWGNKAKEVETTTAETLETKTQEIIANLDKQIAKLEERNRLAGIDPSLGKGDSDVDMQKRDIMTRMNQVATGGEGFEGLDSSARTEIMRALGQQYSDLTSKADRLAAAQEKANGMLKGDKLKEFMDKFATVGEKRSAEILLWKKSLGELYTPDIEKRINEKFVDNGANKEAKQVNRAGIQALEMKQKLEREVLKGGLDEAEALNKQGLMSESQLVYKRLDLKLYELDSLKKYTEAELALAQGDDQKTARVRYIGELAVIEQQRKNVIAGTETEIQQILFDAAQKERDRDNGQLANINAQVQTAQQRVAYYEMLPGAITAAAIAEEQSTLAALQSFEADKAKTDAVKARIAALQELQTWQQQGAQQDLLANDAKKIGDDWANAANMIASTMTTAMGKVGKAAGGVVSVFGELKKTQVDLAQVSTNRLKAVAGNADLIAKEETRAAFESQKASVSAYANMAGAAKGYFEENSAGYKVMQTVENAFRAWQMAMEIKSMITSVTATSTKTSAAVAGKSVEMGMMVAGAAVDTTTTAVSIGNSLAKTAASTVAGVAKAFEQMGVWGFAGAAAILAFMAGMGGNMSGGGGPAPTTFEDRQKTQGTGTVLGDSEAKSESISKSLKIMELNSSLGLDYQNGMLTALKNIEQALGGAAKGVIQTAGITGGSGFGTQNSETKSFWGSDKSTTITDSGVKFAGTFGNLRGTQYEDVTKTSDGGWFHGNSSSNSTNTRALSQEAMRPFALIFDNMGDLMIDAGTKLGMDAATLEKAINSVPIDFAVSLRELSGQDLTDALSAGISVAFDKVAMAVFPFAAKFQKMGEGLGETLVRVATDVTAVDSVFKSMGKPLDSIAAAGIEARVRLVEMAGGLEEFAKQADYFQKNFFSETEQRNSTANKLNPVLAQYGLTTEGSAAQAMFKNFVLGLNTSTAAGAKAYTQLMALAPAFISVTEAAADQRKSLTEEYNELTKSSVELLQMQREALDPSNRAMFDQIQAIKRLKEINEELSNAYETASDAGQENIDTLTSFADSLRGLMNSTKLGDQSILTPQQKYEEARTQYEDTRAKALGGDTNAQSQYAEVARTFLEMSRGANASGELYRTDYQKVLNDAKAAESWAMSQIDIAKNSLEQLRRQADFLSDIRDATRSLSEILLDRDSAMAAVQIADAIVAAQTAEDTRRANVALSAGADYNKPAQSIITPLVGTIEKLGGQVASLQASQQEMAEGMITAMYESNDLNAQAINREASAARRTRLEEVNSMEAYQRLK